MANDTDFRNPVTLSGIPRGNILANISVPWKLNLVTIVMSIGIMGIFLAAQLSIDRIENQQQTNFNFISAPIIALNDADIALGDLQAELILLKDNTLSSEEKVVHLEKIIANENAITSTLQKYEMNWLTPAEPIFDASVSQTNKQRLTALQENEALLFIQIKDAYDVYDAESDVLYQNVKNGVYDSKTTEVVVYDSVNSMHALLRQLISIHSERLQLANEVSQSSYEGISAQMILAVILAIGLGLIISFLVARSINSRLITLSNNALALEDGLLDVRANMAVVGRDEIALVSRSFETMAVRLGEIFSDLEKKVMERTTSLTAATEESNKRARQFEAITKVTHAINTTQNLQELFPQISKVISEQFGFYHVGIFLNNPTNEIAILSAANSEGGKKMLQRNHQLKIGEQGIVGYVTQTGKPRIALDVGEDASYFNNPDLPSTHSEMALPLRVGNQVFGALDIQSTEVGAFTDDDIETLSALADQVSLAIQNARLFDQTKKALTESESVQRQYIRETWKNLPREEKISGYRYSITGAVPLDDETTVPTGEALEDKQEMSVPIILRGETIGTLSVYVPPNEYMGAEQVDLIKAVAERVALSAENARLFENTTRRAARESLVSDITTKIRSHNNPQAMIETTINELRIALQATKVEVIPQAMEGAKNKKA